MNVPGNPVGNELIVAVSGAAGRPLQLRLTDVWGRLIEQRTIGAATSGERQTFNVQRQPSGLLVLQALSGERRQTVKVVKP